MMPDGENDAFDRPDVYVIARILERLWLKGPGYGRTNLQNAARLNTRAFTKYIAWLEAKGYVAKTTDADGHDRFAITANGIEVLRSLAKWIDGTIGQGRL